MNIKAYFLKMLGNVGEFISVLFSKAINDELKIVLPIAARAVAQVSADPTLLSNTDRRNAAIAQILSEIGSAQAQVGLSLVNLAVELAYQKQKAESK